MVHQDLVDAYMEKPEIFAACNFLHDHQEFIVHNPYALPEGLCPSAWADIRPYIMTISSGGSFAFMKEKHMILASCTNLFRPVIFKIERIPAS
jgi:uncharacterized repeat protein (TIGR04076 family)